VQSSVYLSSLWNRREFCEQIASSKLFCVFCRVPFLSVRVVLFRNVSSAKCLIFTFSCLDRTNVAQFSAGVEAMEQQLVVMGIRSNAKLDPSSNIVRVLIDMYVDIGDHVSSGLMGSISLQHLITLHLIIIMPMLPTFHPSPSTIAFNILF
jgi:hypothetical protein